MAAGHEGNGEDGTSNTMLRQYIASLFLLKGAFSFDTFDEYGSGLGAPY